MAVAADIKFNNQQQQKDLLLPQNQNQQIKAQAHMEIKIMI